MSYSSASGREQILQDASAAVAELRLALVALTRLYDELDLDAADRMEESLFRPVQHALGLLTRTLAEFSRRYDLGSFGPQDGAGPGLPADPRMTIGRVSDSTQSADATLAELQDSLLPVEVGDPELRAGLSGTRELLGPIPRRCAELIRTLGR